MPARGAARHGGDPHRRDRRLEAVVALLVWSCGVELLPLGHLALHAALEPHAHGVHDHSGVPHDHAEDGDHADPHAPAWANTSAAPHGAHSLAHRELALHPDVAKLPPVRPPRLGLAPATPPLSPLRERRLATHASARAPPRPAHA
ncbi:MAG: hypothetical protein KF901_33755 [Myxococcales bacterium]|nr:hypothetical protein [Myxococcales bacterium]